MNVHLPSAWTRSIGRQIALISLAALCCATTLAQVNSQQKRLRVIPILSDTLIQDIQESRDGSRLLTHDRGYAPRLWDPRTMRLLGFLVAKSRYPINQATMSEDGTRVVTLAADAVTLWNTRNARQIASWKLATPDDQAVQWTQVQLSPDNQTLVIGDKSGTIWITKTEPGSRLQNLGKHSSVENQRVNDIAFSATGQLVATAAQSGDVLVFSTKEAKLAHTLKTEVASQWLEFSPDEKQLLVTQHNSKATLWNLSTNSKRFDWVHTIADRSIGNTMMAAIFVGPNRSNVLVAGPNGVMTIYDASSGIEVRKLTGYTMPIREIRRARDFVTIATYAAETVFSGVTPLKLWNTETGKEYPFDMGSGNPTAGEFAPDGSYFWLGYDDGAIRKHRLKDGNVATEQIGAVRGLTYMYPMGKQGRFMFEIQSPYWVVKEPKFIDEQFIFDLSTRETSVSPDSPLVVAKLNQQGEDGKEETINAVVNVATKRIIFGLWRQAALFAWAPNSKIFVSDKKSVHLFDMAKPEYVRELIETDAAIDYIKSSPSGDWVIIGNNNKDVVLVNAADPSKYYTLTNNSMVYHHQVAISPDGNAVALVDGDELACFSLIDASKRFSLRIPKIKVGNESFDQGSQVGFSADSTVLYYAGWHFAKGVDAKTGADKFTTQIQPDHAMTGQEGPIYAPDDRLLATSHQNVLNVVDTKTGKLLSRQELNGTIYSIAFYHGSKRLITVDESDQVVVWNLEKILPNEDPTKPGSLERLGSMVTMRDGSWLVMDVEGRYDATDPSNVTGASYVLEWEKGLEPLNVSQFKAAFYEPGLFDKLIGVDLEPRRAVPDLESIRLYPEVTLTQNKNKPQSIEVSVFERDNGGIGSVKVLLNGKVVDERKGVGFFIVDTTKYVSYMLPAARLPEGRGNQLQVLVSNKQGDLTSLPVTMDVGIPGDLKTPEIKLYGLFVGAGDYVGEKRDLAAPMADAIAMAQALKQTGERLLPNRVDITVLATHPDYSRPNRKNILKWFEDVASKATSSDIVFVFFAGHGTSRIGDQTGYFFLTPDADPSDVQPSIIGTGTLSSEDLQKGLTSIAAGKQIIVLDTCHSGAATSSLVQSDRSGGPDYARAYEALKDSTGTWLLAGAAADQLSYESSNVEHGMLTYALLEGLDIASPNALREGEGGTLFVDVERWFTYAVNRVESLKNEVGIAGVQSPQFKRNRTVRSFDIGAMNKSSRGFLGLKPPKPIVIMGTFENADDEDPLKLEGLLSGALHELNSIKLWTEVAKHPNVYRIAGSYSQQGDAIQLKLNIQRFDGAQNRTTLQSYDITGKASDIREMVKQIVQRIATSVDELEQKRATAQPQTGPVIMTGVFTLR